MPTDPLQLVADYLLVTGVAHLGPERDGDPNLLGKRLGLLNGSSWISLWSNFFGRLYLPGVQLINAGSDAVQINFMRAHAAGEPCPPASSIAAFVRMARELAVMAEVDAILITCSTMNRSYDAVAEAVDIPVVQIDMPMMEVAAKSGGKALVIATHGPTVASTQALLQETAERLGLEIAYEGITLEEAWHCLANGDIRGHNRLVSMAIREAQQRESFESVVLAQLSMSVFALEYPNTETEYGVPVYTSGQAGFERMRELLARQAE